MASKKKGKKGKKAKKASHSLKIARVRSAVMLKGFTSKAHGSSGYDRAKEKRESQA